MTTETRLGASRAVLLSATSAFPMLRGPAVAFAPEDDFGGGAPADGGAGEPGDGEGGGREEQPNGNDPAAGADEDEGDQPKPKQSAQERIGELIRRRREADKRAAAAERRAEEAERRLSGHGQGDKPASGQETGPPDPSKYPFGDTDPGFIRDLARHEAKEAYAAEARQSAARAHAQQVEKTWNERQDAFAADKPDYYDKVGAEDLPITRAMTDAIVTSEEGAAVAYHLASNPDEAHRIAALSPLAQIREIGRIEGRIAAEKQSAQSAGEQPKKISDAPTPAPQGRGQGGRFKVAADTDDFAAFEREYGRH